MVCKARQYSDQMSCSKCGLVWDMNDPEPPECPQELKAENKEDDHEEKRS